MTLEHMASVYPSIAIVLPVYNVERYLPECLASILSQTYKNFTVFAVDDGATDNSGKILDEYASRDNRIKVIHKQNGGISSARNAGLSKIESDNTNIDYIYFLDSDDVITADFIEKMVLSADREHADVAICQVVEFHKDGFIKKNPPLRNKSKLNQDEFASLYFELDEYKGSSIEYRFLGNKIFRYNIVKSTRFNEAFRSGEDQDWIVMSVMPFIQSAVIVYDAEFRYRLRRSSLSHSKKILQDYGTFSAAIDNIDRYTLSAQKGIQYRYIETLYAELKHSFRSNDRTKQDDFIGEVRKAASREYRFVLPFSMRRKLLMSYLPRPILKAYYKKRFSKSNTSKIKSQLDFFD